MRIALFDYKITSNNPIGSCHLRMLRGLCQEHEFTVFAVEFDNPCPKRIRFVRVPVPTRPLALLFIAYHLVAPVMYLVHRMRTGARFDMIQMVESNLLFGHVAYVHFCHRAYLRKYWKAAQVAGIRWVLRWLDHWLHAVAEPWVFRRVQWIVVPSRGLERELQETYPFVRGKVVCIPNPVDLERMTPPFDFDRMTFRRSLGAGPEDIVVVFVALGHFEHKGLPLVLEALRSVADTRIRLWVVGGEADLVRTWQERVRGMGLAERVRFVGMQQDVRPFLWAADALIFPSAYETFSLVSFEAAAAGLPLIVTAIYGVEEFMRDGVTGFLVEHSTDAVVRGLRSFLALSPAERYALGQAAKEAVTQFGVNVFMEGWRAFYAARE